MEKCSASAILFLYKVCDTVIDENKTAYPELEEKRELIKNYYKA